MRKFIVYIGILLAFFVLVILIYRTGSMIRSFEHGVIGILLSIIGSFFLGLVIGSLDFIREWKKDGYWKVNKERLLALGLPLFILLALSYRNVAESPWFQSWDEGGSRFDSLKFR